jgi:hypothetical protein
MKTSPDGAPILTGHALQRIKEQVEKEFAKARTVERRRYAHPGVIDPRLGGRRKDDKPQGRPALSQLAQPILLQIQATGTSATTPHRRRHDGAVMWDIGDAPVVEDVPKLFDAALMALGYQPENPPDEPSPRTCVSAEPEKKSIWKRGIFQKGA